MGRKTSKNRGRKLRRHSSRDDDQKRRDVRPFRQPLGGAGREGEGKGRGGGERKRDR